MLATKERTAFSRESERVRVRVPPQTYTKSLSFARTIQDSTLTASFHGQPRGGADTNIEHRLCMHETAAFPSPSQLARWALLKDTRRHSRLPRSWPFEAFSIFCHRSVPTADAHKERHTQTTYVCMPRKG